VLKPKPEPKPVPQPIEKPKVVPVDKDTDRDGVVDRLDRCNNTPRNTPVDTNGCQLFVGVIEGVEFQTGSALLTPSTTLILDNVVAQLIKYPSINIEISAHTDNQGDDKYNFNLSRDRVISVARYLVRRGIPQTRLTAKAYGETRPIADNNTVQGRKQNRRVEIRSIK
jgi:OOP family OmpA-OmpF porin